MNIEILVRVGDCVVDDDGIVRWQNSKHSKCVISCSNYTEGVKTESLKMVEKIISSLIESTTMV